MSELSGGNRPDSRGICRPRTLGPAVLVLLGSLLLTAPMQAAPGGPSQGLPLLVVMAPTGQSREGLPVYVRHRAAEAHETVLLRGFSGRWLRLFRLEQQWLSRRDGRPIEPAYLLLSTNEGGFPRFGFWLDGQRKAGVGYVDLHERSRLAGRFGAMDQIFPHELAHVIVQQLASPPPPGAGGANQVHAIGVRTDRITAFNEGFAEHVQLLAVDDPEADDATSALADDLELASRAADRLGRYRRALEARWAPAPPARMGFALWFSGTEQVLRYHAVRANAFAREPEFASRLIATRDPYLAYLLENVLPGAAGSAVKSTPRLLATEGVIAALFSRWVSDARLRQPVADAAFYRAFGAERSELEALDHAYLKLFAVLAERAPHDTAALVEGYVQTFPGEADAVSSLMRELGFVWPLPRTPEVWLASEQFKTGTTLFDQYRALPRTHTFDLNAASRVDLSTVDGVTPRLSTAILAHGPYASLDALAAVPGVTAPVLDKFRRMQGAMDALRTRQAGEDIESIDLMAIFRPVVVRAIGWVLLVACLSAVLYRAVFPCALWRALLNGLVVGATGLFPAWILAASGAADAALSALVPVVLFGVPAAAWQLARHRSARRAGRCIAAWALAAFPGLLVLQPLF